MTANGCSRPAVDIIVRIVSARDWSALRRRLPMRSGADSVTFPPVAEAGAVGEPAPGAPALPLAPGVDVCAPTRTSAVTPPPRSTTSSTTPSTIRVVGRRRGGGGGAKPPGCGGYGAHPGAEPVGYGEPPPYHSP